MFGGFLKDFDIAREARATYGPRDTCGLPSILMWPVNIFCVDEIIKNASFKKHPAKIPFSFKSQKVKYVLVVLILSA